MVKILKVKTSVIPKEDMEQKLNKTLEENDICENNIINIQYIKSSEIAVFYIK